MTATPVASVNMTSLGSGYSTAPTVAFTGGGGGSGAAGTAAIVFGTTAFRWFISRLRRRCTLKFGGASRCRSGRSYVRNLMRRLDVLPPGVSSPLDLTSFWQNVFGALPDSTPYRIVFEANSSIR